MRNLYVLFLIFLSICSGALAQDSRISTKAPHTNLSQTYPTSFIDRPLVLNKNDWQMSFDNQLIRIENLSFAFTNLGVSYSAFENFELGASMIAAGYAHFEGVSAPIFLQLPNLKAKYQIWNSDLKVSVGGSYYFTPTGSDLQLLTLESKYILDPVAFSAVIHSGFFGGEQGWIARPGIQWQVHPQLAASLGYEMIFLDVSLKDTSFAGFRWMPALSWNVSENVDLEGYGYIYSIDSEDLALMHFGINVNWRL
ncbi:MAG: hypothetical protein HYS98_03455 [Deltaproteobacteria bacterium]|nr:hypothetical protein [Deltaproteobacteria bacterium]